ncbi:MAG: LptF/LptG family permease [Armatimonadota bacterium]
MKLLYRHILRELIGPFLFGVAAFTSIMFAGKELFKITELLAEFGAPPLTAIELVILFLPSLVVMTLPMSMLLTALLGFGRLSGDSEVVALFASGISLYRIALPVVIMAVIVTAGGFVLNEVVAPEASLEHERIMKAFTKEESASSGKPFIAIDSDDNITNTVVYVQGGLNIATGKLREVAVIQYKDNKPSVFIYANEAVWDRELEDVENGKAWVFKNGYYNSLGTESRIITQFSKLDTHEVNIGKTPDELALYQKKPDQMSFNQLKGYITMLQSQGQDVNEFRVKLYQKVALPLSSLIFALIGIPLGLRPQRSSSAMGLGLSIVIIFSYWVLMHYMTILGNNGVVSPAAASFIPTLVGTFIGTVLIIKAAK